MSLLSACATRGWGGSGRGGGAHAPVVCCKSALASDGLTPPPACLCRCGIAPERVPERMKSHVASMASRYPQCFKSAAAPAAPTPSPPPQVVPSPPPKAVPSPPPKAVPSPPPPKAASQGSWGSPIPIDKLPFLGEELRVIRVTV